ncbi:hypothetical protein SUGI_0059370 [Cryptomeria japonica]|uniref:probable beta-D-xylosidase 6 n=1 Tax=Cryptomeria japonica TaxID=3369 RepID=UPI002408DC22|nr:probable beta-D-xylosidase 6 [Cryptomeria japonica]GLJ07128.1 hypothetical protein SUGI_0059370 [Cryptomeria japonica]
MKKFCAPILIVIVILPLITYGNAGSSMEFACDQRKAATKSFDFCNTSLPIKNRVEDIIRRLTLKEKVAQLYTSAEGIERLGIPAYEWWSESLHGIAPNGPGVRFNGSIKAATMFPQVILTAASFNETLWSAIAGAVAVEARAMYNSGQAGLTFWAPNINIFRDPRWGRGQETPGEDPLITSRYAVVYVTAFQGEQEKAQQPSSLMLSACCKHFTAYDLEKWHNYSRYSFDAVVNQQDLEDTFQPPFKSCVKDGHASCMMCSYNQVNGVPACANRDFLSKLIRSEWQFEGYITSDCDAVAVIFENQKYVDTPEDAVADVLKAGMDINCGTYLLRHTLLAMQKGKLHESFIDRALFNLFSVRIRLGLFDGDTNSQTYGNLKRQDVCSDEHRHLALEAARQGIVLLKNKDNTLPLLKSKIASLALIGPNANALNTSLGDYAGTPCKIITPLIGLTSYIKRISYSPGCQYVNCTSTDGFEAAERIVAQADAVIMIMGLDQTQETEDHDRVDLTLPGKQQKLISKVAGASKGPVILVLMCGGPVDVSFAKEDPRISSILWIGYPGEAGGQALAEVIFGDYNPGGRLPMTWYPQDFTKVPMNIMNMRPNASTGYPGRTYRFYTGETVFEYGYGLSYSNYSYKFVSSNKQLFIPRDFENRVYSLSEVVFPETKVELPHIYVDEYTGCQKIKFALQVLVYNHGSMNGSHVMLLYSKPPATHRGVPQKQLIGFTRVHVASGKSMNAEFVVSPCEHLSTVTEDGRRLLSIGFHTLIIGDSQLNLSLTTHIVT